MEKIEDYEYKLGPKILTARKQVKEMTKVIDYIE